MGRTVSVFTRFSEQLRQTYEAGKAGPQREATPAGQGSISHNGEVDSLSSWFSLASGSVCSRTTHAATQVRRGWVVGVGEKDTSKAAEEVRLSWVQPSRPSKPCSAPGSRGLESRHWGFGWPSRARSSCIMPGCARPNLQMEDRPWGAGLQVLSASTPGRPGHPTLCSPLSQGTSPGRQWSPFRPGGPWLRRLLWLDSPLWG